MTNNAQARNGGSAFQETEELIADYLDQLNSGKRLDPIEILAEHPERGQLILDALKDFLALGVSEEDATAPLGTLGDYTLRRQIGRGGMGVVYEAWENSMDRAVALKVLPAGIAADTKACTRFMREAQTAGKLNHPTVVGVYSTGVKEGTPWYSMEYVDGETLAQILAKIKDAEPETETPFGAKDEVAYFHNMAKVFADVADGLQHAHSKGIVHRDIKPSNLILDADGKLRILDFGLARLEGQESLTLSGDLMGTPLYMSPEQARRKKIPVDHRTDVYSLGATIYEALCGRPPFRGKDHADTLSQIIERDPQPPSQLNVRVPADLEKVVLKCLRKDAENRYRTAEALSQDLRRFVRGDPVEAQAQSPWERTARRLWRQRRLVLAAGAVLITLLVVSVIANVLITRAWDAKRSDFYVASIRLAAESWKASNFSRLAEQLDHHIPQGGEPDLRGWEWYYLDGLRDGELLSFQGHTRSVTSAAWQPQGDLLASGSIDGTVRIWEVATGREVERFEHGAPVQTVAWSPDGERLVVGSSDGSVRIWRVAGQDDPLLLLAHQTAAVSAVAWSSNGDWLATGDKGGTLKIWNAREEQAGPSLSTFEPGVYDSGVFCLAFSADGQHLAAGGRGYGHGSLLVWSTATWGEPRRLRERALFVRALSWSPDSHWLATGAHRHGLKIFDTQSWQELTLLGHVGPVSSLSWSPDGSWLASGSPDGMIQIWDPSTRERHNTLRGHSGAPTALSWSPDSKRLASGSRDRTLKIWDAFSEQETLGLPATTRAAWSPDGQWVAAEAEKNEYDEFEPADIAVYNAATGERVADAMVDVDCCYSLAFSPDGGLLAGGERDGRLRVVDWREGRDVLHIEAAHPRELRMASWSPNGLLATCGAGGVKIWELSSRQPVQEIPVPGIVYTLAWSPHGTRLAAPGLGVWDTVKRANLVPPLPAGPSGGKWFSMTWSPDGERLACGGTDGAIGVFAAATGDEIYSIPQAHTSLVGCISWSPDGRRLASGGNDHTVNIWDAETGEELLTLRGHKGDVLSVAWHPEDSARLLSAGYQDSVKIWEAPGYGECVFRRSWTANPEEAGHLIRRKVDTHSEGSWTAIPKEGGHQVRRNPMRLSHDTGRRVSSIRMNLPWST